MGELSIDPLIPPTLWLTLALAGVALLAWYVGRRPPILSRSRWGVIVSLMALAVVVVMGLLLNPTWVREIPPPPGKPLLTVLVDASASMATPDSAGGKTRFASAHEAVRRMVRRLDDRFEVRVHAFARDSQPIDPNDLHKMDLVADGTDVAAALRSSIDPQRQQGQAIVLLSDGIHNTTGGSQHVLDAVRLAKAMAAPIYTRTFGGEYAGHDLMVSLRSSQDMVVVGQKMWITAQVRHVGPTAGKATVVLLQGDQEIARREVLLQPSVPADVHFAVQHEQTGVHSYEIRAEPLSGETSQANNAASYVLRVVDEPIRVLVLEGKPYWDSKFFIRTLTSDPAIALDSIVKMAEKRLIRRTLSSAEKKAGGEEPPAESAAPAEDAAAKLRRSETFTVLTDAAEALRSYDALRGYQIVVLGRDAEVFLSDEALANLKNWIARDGGSLVCYRGAPASQINQRLASLLPVKWTPGNESRFHVQLTEQGREMNWLGEAGDAAGMLARLPTLASRMQVDTSKPLAVVLATAIAASGENEPAVVYHPYGSGRVVVIEGAGMWRWAFLPPQYQQHEQVYSSLWHSLIRWLTSGHNLMPGQTLSLRADKVRFSSTEPATVTVLAREQITPANVPTVELKRDGSDQVSKFAPAPVGDEAGVYRVNFGQLPEGRYHAQLTGSDVDETHKQVVFDVRSLSDEQINLWARPDLMKRIGADSGGAEIGQDAGAIDQLFSQHMARTRPPRIERISAWDRWWILASVVALWSATWSLRRMSGLV